MNYQEVLNISIGVVIAAAGWIGRQMWDAMVKLREDLHQLETDLPKSYVMKIDLDKRMDHIETMFQRIYDKLDEKADK